MKKLTIILICCLFVISAGWLGYKIGFDNRLVFTENYESVQNNQPEEYDIVGQWILSQFVVVDRGVESVEEIEPGSIMSSVYTFYNDGTISVDKTKTDDRWEKLGTNEYMYYGNGYNLSIVFVNADCIKFLDLVPDKNGATSYYVLNRYDGAVSNKNNIRSITEEDIANIEEYLNELKSQH